ncbi:hypothetical protein ACLOJK_030751 [Asimina triloba]
MALESDLEIPNIAPIQIGNEDPTQSQTVEEECQTPKSDNIKPLTVCPPAPKKRRPPPRKARPSPLRYFVVPDDLASIFTALPVQANKRIKSGKDDNNQKPAKSHVLIRLGNLLP